MIEVNRRQTPKQLEMPALAKAFIYLPVYDWQGGAKLQSIKLIILLTTLLSPANVQWSSQSIGIIQGMVRDLNGVAIPNMPVIAENINSGGVKAGKSNLNGEYRIFVEPGRYRLKLPSSVGYPTGAERSSFEVTSEEAVNINFRPRPLAISSGIKHDKPYSEYVGRPRSVLKYFINQPSSTLLRELHIEFGGLSTNQDTWYYSDVSISYEQFSFVSDRCTIDIEKRMLCGEGNVIFEDGKKSTSHKKLCLNIGDQLTIQSNAR